MRHVSFGSLLETVWREASLQNSFTFYSHFEWSSERNQSDLAVFRNNKFNQLFQLYLVVADRDEYWHLEMLSNAWTSFVTIGFVAFHFSPDLIRASEVGEIQNMITGNGSLADVISPSNVIPSINSAFYPYKPTECLEFWLWGLVTSD